jgi:hypothetical protein
MDGSVGAFSPDGSKFAAILWRGNHSRNINVSSLVLFEMGAAMARIAPTEHLTALKAIAVLIASERSHRKNVSSPSSRND